MIVHSYYEEDPRVRREAEALVARGREVDVFALRQPGLPRSEVIEGVHLTRLDVRRQQGAGLRVYLAEYLWFFVRSGWALTATHRRRRYGIVQVHSLPDFLVFATLPLRLVGVPVILDLHEAMPEFFRTRFPGADNRLTHWALLLQERLAIAYASKALSVNELMADRLLSLGIPAAKVAIVPNSPNLALFDPTVRPRRGFREDGSLRIVYTGALTPTYELDVSLDAVARLAGLRPDIDVRLELYGRGDSEEMLRQRAVRLGIADRVTFHGRIPIEDVPSAVARADIGIAPTRLDDFTRVSLSTKVFEYGAMGKPVVASRLPLVERTFPEGTVAAYEPGVPAAMVAAILGFVDDPVVREAAVARTTAVIQDHAWEREADRYAALVASLERVAR
jgi:glycosyltransferase involved in cell wall biosynthesis